jgi:hypothetical protein
MSGVSVKPLIGVAVIQSCATLAAWIAMRRLDFARDMCRFRDFLIFALIGPGALALVTAAAATGFLSMPGPEDAGVVARSWLACATGCMLVAPALLVDDSASVASQPTRGGWTLIICVGILMLGSQMRGFPESLTATLSWMLFATATLGAMFHGARTVTLMLVVAGISAIVGAGLAAGPFDHPADASERVLILVKLCLLAFTAMGVGVVRAERQRLFTRDSERLQRIVASGQRDAGEDAERRMAGNLNQPLSAIRTYAQTAARVLRRGNAGAGSGAGEPQRVLEEALSQIVSGTEQAADLVRSGCQGASLPRSNVGAFIAQSLGEANWELASRNIHLEQNIESDLPPVLVAAEELERIVLIGLHASIGRALASHGRRVLRVRCAHDVRSATVRVEFGVSGGAGCAEPVLRPEWLAGLERFEGRGGYFRVDDRHGRHLIKIGMPVAPDALQEA